MKYELMTSYRWIINRTGEIECHHRSVHKHEIYCIDVSPGKSQVIMGESPAAMVEHGAAENYDNPSSKGNDCRPRNKAPQSIFLPPFGISSLNSSHSPENGCLNFSRQE
jgi:hypothetical protein